MIRIVVVSAIVSLLSGCMTVRDYDSSKIEMEQINKIKAAQAKSPKVEHTADYVKIADEEDVLIEAIKSKPLMHKGVQLEVWDINANNKSNEAKCVTITWALQDFSFETSLPHEFLVQPNKIIKIGKMTQSIWDFDDVAIAAPPSGYVHDINVREADVIKKSNKLTCEVLEDDIEESKTRDTISF